MSENTDRILWSLLSRRAVEDADVILLEGAGKVLSAAQLVMEVSRLAETLGDLQISALALWADNGPAWIVVDLACQLAGVRLVPLPLFFSSAQVQHGLLSAGVDALASDSSAIEELLPESIKTTIEKIDPTDSQCVGLTLYRLPPQSCQVPEGTGKITFTSGSTGEPKGVCLSSGHQLRVAQSLADILNLKAVRHLCLLPLSTLLENVAGVYAPLLSRGQVIAPSLKELGLQGSSKLDISALTSAFSRYQPETVILVPELLRALVLAAKVGWQPPDSLRFVAVGGARVAPDLIQDARACGLPVYEGYGLSECASVVSLNTPEHDLPGSAGLPLPHLKVVAEQGELLVFESGFLGYLNEPESWNRPPVATGDLGSLDADGFVRIEGRKGNRLISSFGRNISPEWVESELLVGSLLAQVVVVGDSRPFCSALLYPLSIDTSEQKIQGWLDAVNQRLPDYARVGEWLRLPRPLTFVDGFLTSNGRPRREEISKFYRAEIDALYKDQQESSLA